MTTSASNEIINALINAQQDCVNAQKKLLNLYEQQITGLQVNLRAAQVREKDLTASCKNCPTCSLSSVPEQTDDNIVQ